jgi:PIN domain nuclease of toxin-antitoxin system
MSTKYVVDSWAWIEYLDGSEIGKKVAMKLKAQEVFTNIVTIAEVISKVGRKQKDPDIAFRAMTSLSNIVAGDDEFAKRVGLLHSGVKKEVPNFSLGDAFTLYTAKSLSAKVLTGDPDFKGIKEAEML